MADRARTGQMVRSILIVDDNAFIRKALCEMFKREEDFDICGVAIHDISGDLLQEGTSEV